MYAIRKISISLKTTHSVKEVRNFKHFIAEDFKSDLSGLPWSSIGDFENPNGMWNEWKRMFLSVVNKHAPIKRKRVCNKKSPWINSRAKQLMIQRDRLKSKAKKTNNPANWLNYKNAKNLTNNEIKKIKAAFYKDNLRTNSGNPSEIWSENNK